MLLLYMVLAWAAGIALASSASAQAGPIWVLCVIVGLGAAILFRRDVALRWAGLCVFALGLGMARFESAQPQFGPNDLATYNDRGQAELIGVVDDDPDVRDTSVGLRVVVERRDNRPAQGVALVFAARSDRFRYGDRVQISGEPQTPPEFDTFSYRDYLARGGIYTLVRNAQVSILARDQGSPVWAALYSVRTAARELLNRLLPDPQAALLAGILLGDERGIAPDIADDFRLTNTTHLIAISGANIAVIVGLLLAISGRLMGRWPSILVTIAGVMLYTLFVGASPSVVRAAIMATLTLVALRFGRERDALTALAISVWIMTAINPLALFDLGLILSVLATLGLILYATPLHRAVDTFLSRLFQPRTARGAALMLSDTLLITITAQITTLPAILLISRQFTPWSLAVNALVAPAQPWIMTLGLLALVLGGLLTPAGQIAAWLAALPTAYTLAIIRAVAALPGISATIEIAPPAVVLYYVALFGLTAFASQPAEVRNKIFKGARLPVAGGAGLAVAALVWIGAISRPDGLLHVHFLAVGEGNAVLIQTPRGAHILIDGGENPTRLQTALGDRLPYFVRDLDLLFITEPKSTTIAALPSLLDRYNVRSVLTNGQPADTGTYRALQAALRRSAAPVQRIMAGWQIETDDGVQIAVISPADVLGERATYDDAPLILRLAFGEASFLLMSDVSETGMRRLLESGAARRATVLQLPSNGAEKSNPPELLTRVGPQVAILLAEAGNRNAQPAESVLARLEAAKVGVFRTDQRGSIEVVSDGASLKIYTRR